MSKHIRRKYCSFAKNNATLLLVAIIFFIFTLNLSAEYLLLDTLRERVKTVSGKEKVDILIQISERLYFNNHINAIDTLREAIRLSQKLSYWEGNAEAYLNLAKSERQLGRQNQALSNFNHALKIYTELENHEKMINCNNEIGKLYQNMQEYGEALTYYLMAFDLSKKVESYLGKGQTNFSLATIYLALNDDENTLEYFERAVENFFHAGDSASGAQAMMYVGSVYQNMIKNKKYQNLQTTLDYYNKAKEILERNVDVFMSSNVNKFFAAYWIDRRNYEKAEVYLNKAIKFGITDKNNSLLSDCYTILSYTARVNGDYQKMLEFNKKACDMRLYLGDVSLLSSSYTNIGASYFLLKDYKLSLEFFFKGLEFSRKANNKAYVVRNLERISATYDSLGKQDLAFDYYKQYAALKDSIRNQELLLDIMGFRLKSDLSKRESEIIELQSSKQVILIYLLITVAVLLLGLTVAIIIRYREKTKDNKLLANQKDMLTRTLQELNESREELKLLNEQLEERVIERTDELEQEMINKKVVQEKLDKTSEILNKMSVTAPMIAYINNLKTKEIVWQNKSLLKMLGYSRTEEDYPNYNLEDVFRLIHNDDISFTTKKSLLSYSEHVAEYEFRMKAADGTWRWFFAKHVPYKIEEDGTVSEILGISMDITERRKVQDLLVESENRYRLIAENTMDIIWTADFDYRLTYVSPSVRKFLDYDVSELIGKYFWHYASEQEKSDILKLLTVDNGNFPLVSNDQATFSLEISQHHRNGEIIPSEMLISIMKDASGNNVGVVGITRNITDRKKAEKKLKSLNQELEKANLAIENALKKEKDLNQMKSRFIQMISHEFRTPLTVILSSAELINLYLKKQDYEKAMQFIRKITNSVDLMTHLIDDVFTFSKFQEGNLELNRVIIDLVDFSGKIVQEITILDNSNHIIKINSKVESLKVMSDFNYLRQIYIHLLMNAVKFSPYQSEITITIEHNYNNTRFRIKDEGEGISEIEREDLFKVFHRRDQDIGIVPGIGLGLAMVKKFVDALEWTLAFETELGRGTEFIITIPEKHLVN